MKTLTLFLLLLVLSHNGLTQLNFYNTYGGDGNDYGESVVTTPDSGYVIVGATESFGNGITDVYLFKIDSVGLFKWSRYFGGNNVDWGTDLVTTSDNGFLIVGYSNSISLNYDGYIIKTNNIGVTEWEKRIGGSDWDFFYSTTKTNDNNYIIAGETFSFGNGQSDGYIVKIDNNGDTLWTKAIGGIYKDKINEVKECSNGDLIFTGKKQNSNSDFDLWVFKTNSQGILLWEFVADGDNLDDEANDIIELIDGNYFVVGYFTSSISGRGKDIWYKKIDPNGTEIYDRREFPNLKDEEGVYALQYSPHSDMHIGAITEAYGFGKKEVMYTKISYGGGMIAGTNFTRGTTKNDVLSGASLTLDSGIVMVGWTESTINGNNSVFVLKKDSLSQTPSGASENLDVSIKAITKSNISLSPVPAIDNLDINNLNANSLPLDFEIINNEGKIIKTGTLTTKKLSLNFLETGLYFIHLKGTNINETLKFIKL